MSTTPAALKGPRTTPDKSWFHYYLRSLFIYVWFSSDKMQALSCLYVLAPLIKANARNDEDIRQACITNVQFFNTQPFMANFIMGIAAAMVERHEPQESIQAIKVGLMGPFAGIGDSMLWFTVRPIVFSIGAGLALQGSAFGPIFSLLVFWFIGQYIIRYHGFRIGYLQGTRFLEEFAETGVMQEITDAISIVGVTVLGTLVSTWVRASSPLVYYAGEGEGLIIQDMIDMLMPKALPALFTLFAYWMLAKKQWHPLIVIGVFMFGGVILAYFNIL